MVAVFLPNNTTRKEEIIHGGGVEMVQSFQNAELWAGGSLVTSSTLSGTVPNGVLLEFNGASSTIYINNTLGASGNGGTAGITAVTLAVGYHPVPGPSRLTGDLYEILIYNRILTSGERSTLASYINSTYQTPTQTGAVTLSSTTTLTANGVREQSAAVTLTASSTLTSQAQVTEQAAVSLISSSTLSSDGIRSAVSTVSLQATAALTATGSTATTFSGAVSLTTAQSFATDGLVSKPGAVSLTATASHCYSELCGGCISDQYSDAHQ
jgi:hypothetical protein